MNAERVVGEALAGIVPACVHTPSPAFHSGNSRWVIARCLPRASEVQPPGALAITLPRTMMGGCHRGGFPLGLVYLHNEFSFETI